MIDFGGATFEDDYHTSIINTRQYRAPEVILQCCQWDEKSDIWSMACIIVEIYTGELFFPTHQDYEHLALIEKAFGCFPRWMAMHASKEYKKKFLLEENEEIIKARGHLLNWPIHSSSQESLENYMSFEKLGDLIKDNDLLDLLNSMFKHDPGERKSAKELLQHQYFLKNY